MLGIALFGMVPLSVTGQTFGCGGETAGKYSVSGWFLGSNGNKEGIGSAGANTKCEAMATALNGIETAVDGLSAVDPYTKEEMDKQIATVNTEIATKADAADLTDVIKATYTKEEMDAQITTVNKEIATKADAADLDVQIESVNTKIATKADAADLTDVIKATYTKPELDAQITTVNTAIATKADAADLANAIETYKQLAADLSSRIDALQESHQQQVDAMAADFAAKLVAAAPCAKFSSEVNTAGDTVCTMKVDRVESLRAP